MKKVNIVDYGCGNILSLQRAIERVGFQAHITKNKKIILNSDFLILPGVGAFSYAMNLLRENNLINTLNDYVINKKGKILGICLGMQLFMSKSFEMGEHKGLNFIEGEVIKINNIKNSKDFKIPHISWNEVFLNNKIKKQKLLDNKIINKDFYFVHSYIAKTSKDNETLAYCKYFDINVPAIIQKNNIIGCQFHPEKSGVNGFNFLNKILTDN